MCNFFSFCTQPSANSDFYYFDWKQRLEMKHNGADSHSHICAHYKLDEDKCNKWEYNPLTKELTLDMQNDPKDDTKRAKRWVEKLDWKAIVEPLVIKPIINPFKLPAVKSVTDEQLGWLKEWASVRDSVGASVGASVRDSVWESVWASVWAYISSFVAVEYNHDLYNHDLSSAIKLWESGLVPSFDGTTWRLHSGKKAEIVYEWKKEVE